MNTKTITKETFTNEYNTMTNKDMAAKYEISMATIARPAKILGLTKAGKHGATKFKVV